MPDRAIKQHFLTKKTTSAVIDGSGVDQVIQVPEDSAEPQFYYLRDGDGSRKTLEVRDSSVPEPVPANSSVGGMPVNQQHGNDAVPFSGMATTYGRMFKDPQVTLKPESLNSNSRLDCSRCAVQSSPPDVSERWIGSRGGTTLHSLSLNWITQ